MSDVDERSDAMLGSHGAACREAFERWAEKDGRLRTIRKTNGAYLDASTRWAWEGWQAVTLTDAEREAIERLCEATRDSIADDKRADGCHWRDDQKALDVVRNFLSRPTRECPQSAASNTGGRKRGDLIPPLMPEELDALIQTTERVQQLEAELAKFRLTEAEQLAVTWAAREADEWDEEDTPEVYAHAEVLAGLFRRLT